MSKQPVTNLCPEVDKTKPFRLNLNVSGESLHRLPETDPQFHGLENSEPISLAQGLLQNETELDFKGKVCLAVVLSYALLDFCGEPWFPGGWTKHSIHLMQINDKLVLRPALITKVSPAPQIGRNNPLARNDLKLLCHGILLMEIFRQESLAIAVKGGGEFASLKQSAQKSFDAIKWDVHERYRQAVEACILDERLTVLADSAGVQNDFVQMFCNAVISPLEHECEALCGQQDPDEMITSMKLPTVKQKKPAVMVPHLQKPKVSLQAQPEPSKTY